jgi:hypothetical protein
MPHKVTVGELEYPDWPLETLGISIVEGTPKGSGKIIFQTSGFRSNFWMG